MKKYRCLASVLLIMMVLFTSKVFAESETLDIEKVAIKTIQHSPAVKSKNNSLKLTQDRYSKDLNVTNARNVRSILYAPLNAEYQINLSDGARQITENSTRLSSYAQYINVIKAKYAVDAQQKLVDSLNSQNEEAKVKFNSGSISPREARIVKSNLEKQRLILQKYQRNMDAAVVNLNKNMGEPILKKYDIYIDNNIKPSDTIRPLEDYIKDSLTNRSEIINAEKKLELTKVDQQISVPNQLQPSQVDYYLASSKYDLDQAQDDVDSAKIQVQLDLTSGYKELESALKNWENEKILYDSAKSDYDLANNNYESGTINKKELTDSEIALTQAEIQLKSAELDLWIYEIKMDVACGIGPGTSQK